MDYSELFISTKLPKPLNQEELIEYMEQVACGDKKAREIVIIHNIKLVLNRVMNRFANVAYEKKVLVSVGIIGLIKAVDTYDISKNVKFSTLATRCIDNEILMYIRKLKQQQKEESFDNPITIDKEGNKLSIEDVIADENLDFVSEYADNELQKLAQIQIREQVELLKARDKEIIKLYFGFHDNKQYTQNEIGLMFGIFRSYVSRIINSVLRKIKRNLTEQKLIDMPIQSVYQEKLKKEKDNDKEIEKMPKKLQSIYEYFREYKKSEVDAMLLKLTDEERTLVKLSYGEDLENPVRSKEWTKENNTKFYNLLKKMKKLLDNPNNIHKSRGRKPKATLISSGIKELIPEKKKDEAIVPVVEEKKDLRATNNNEIKNEDYIKMLEFIKTPTFAKMIKKYSPKETIIISLKLGYIEGKYFSTTAIANFLGIDSQEVIDTTKKILIDYKKKVNEIIEETIKVATAELTNDVKKI